MSRGAVYAILAYALWGLFPLYFARVAAVPTLEVVLHRSVWSLVFVFALMAWLRRFAWLAPALREPRLLALFALSAVLLSGNWLLYVWAVTSHRVIDASLGYFINPLVSVMLGVLVLRERLRPAQWAAVALAAAGVAWLTVQAGQLPWVALALAMSFGAYGLLRKTATLGALEGLALETLLLAPLAIGLLGLWSLQGRSALVTADATTIGWLLLAGPLTALPLLLFAAAARRLPLATLGLLQYLAPTIQLVLGIWVFHEPFSAARLAGFALIWLALAVYSAEGLWLGRATRPAPIAAPTTPGA
jgi:chloramphenicol-sensitive protein RarD